MEMSINDAVISVINLARMIPCVSRNYLMNHDCPSLVIYRLVSPQYKQCGSIQTSYMTKIIVITT